MSLDQQLVDTVKANFARKSSAQLQEIVQGNNQDRWSPEAVTAATQVLRDRQAGQAQEPAVPEEEPPPPPRPPDPYSLAFMALGLLSGLSDHMHIHIHFHLHDYANEPDPDLPVPFGSKIAWLALDTADTQAVASALDLRSATDSTWTAGIEAAHKGLIFVTPPLADWTLVAGTALFPPDRAEPFVKPLLERLSRQFGDAQYFCTHRDVELHLWARARKGELVRGYGWLGEKGLTLWDEGRQTKEERDLGFRFLDGRSPAVEQTVNNDLSVPDEGCVMQLACLWSIDPTTLDAQAKEPGMGLLGTVEWVQSRASQ